MGLRQIATRLYRVLRPLCVTSLAALLVTPLVIGQDLPNEDKGSIARAILALRDPTTYTIDQRRLYGGTINARIFNGDGDPDRANFAERDRIDFEIHNASSSVRCGSPQAPFTRGEFDRCVRNNAGTILNILFPASLSASVAGRDEAQNHSQLFLLTTALGAANPSRGEAPRKRAEIAGLVEREWFSGGAAWQGLYQLNSIPLSFHGRYARQDDGITTRSGIVAADFHPSWRLNPALEWRIGLDARSGLLFSRSDAMDLGSVDLGGGVWTSVRKDFSRIRLGGATLFQGSKSRFPTSFLPGELQFLAKQFNERAIDYDAAYGGLVGFLTSARTSVNGKFIETRPISSDRLRPPSRIGIVGFSYLLDGITPIDVGYKISKSGGLAAHSVFVQGNFRF